MTIEEAIKHFEAFFESAEKQDAEFEACFPGWKSNFKKDVELYKIALAALRAKQGAVKLDRSRWERCYICKDAIYLDGDICVSGTYHIRPDFFEYCPNCGRPLTEEAWAEMERRMNGG